MFVNIFKAAFALLLTASFLLQSNVSAQDDASEFQLPKDPAAWINSPPITLEVLKGKAAVLYFFEES